MRGGGGGKPAPSARPLLTDPHAHPFLTLLQPHPSLTSVAQQLEVVEGDLEASLDQLGEPAQLDPRRGREPLRRGGGGGWLTASELVRLQTDSASHETKELEAKVARLEVKVIMYVGVWEKGA